MNNPINTSSAFRIFLQIAVLTAFGLVSAQASVITGFETSSGYGTNTTVIGVDDSGISGTDTWVNSFNTPAVNSRMVTSTANPQSGSQALRFTNDGSSGALGATLQLGSSVSVANPFTVHFAMALNNISSGTGNQAQVYFGQNAPALGAQPYWFALLYNDGVFNLYLNNAANNGSDFVNLGLYTTYSTLGSYVTFDLTIDPTTNKFTNVQITGSLTSANLTSTVLASPSGGTIPHLSATPNTYFSFMSGGNDTITADFDNLAIVPEPSTYALLILGSFGLSLMARNRQRLTKNS